jgi:hypothetical protein
MPIYRYGVGNPDLTNFVVDEDAVIWRYMDIGKYLDLLVKRKLWFARAIELRKADPYEGTTTRYDDEKLEKVLSCATKSELKEILNSFGDDKIYALVETMPNASLEWLKLLYYSKFSIFSSDIYAHAISCWHANRTESDAMWALYARRHAGIAIRSSVRSLLEACRKTAKNIAVGKVVYDSENNLSTLLPASFIAFFVKRNSFSHENEVRMITDFLDGYESPNWTPENQMYTVDASKSVQPGLYVECDLAKLVEEIVISPLSPIYLSTAIKEITRTFAPEIPVRQSKLNEMQYKKVVVSDNMALLLQQYHKTGRLRDFDQIGNEADGFKNGLID